jgi:predicted signal transduction protein with EAL and GGDEF domain
MTELTRGDVVSLDAKRVAARGERGNVQLSFQVDDDGRILRSRVGAIQAFGLGGSDMVGDAASDLFVADDVLSARALLHRASRGALTSPVQLRMRRIDGAELVVRVSARPTDAAINVRIRECDETERAVFDADAPARARLDPLTDLPNRVLLLEQGGRALAAGPHMFVVVDIDGFRDLVSALGSRAGERILVEVADRLVASIGPSGVVGLSAGQFVAVAPVDTRPDMIQARIGQLRAAINVPFAVNGADVVLTACLGIALSHASGSAGGSAGGSASAKADPVDAEALLADAEVALGQAKSLGPAHDAVFEPAFRRRAVHQVEIQSELARALTRNELRLDFQPIVELEADTIVGYEALVRWQHPQRGKLAPADFLAAAQRTGAGAAIDDWVLVEACRKGASWERSGEPTTICVNVMPERFAVAGLVDRVEHALSLTGLDPARLVVEITEWSILVDVCAARDTLHALNQLGVRVALDDYGTGYSSLANVAALPVDELKIDTSFVAGLGSDRPRTAIVRAIVGLGHALGITVVAEGVENAAQAFALRALGCEFGQGFHFGRPGPGPALISRTS